MPARSFQLNELLAMFHCSRQYDANRKLRLIYKSGEMSLKITAKVSPEKRGKRCEKCLPSQHANRGERGHFTYNVCTEGAGKAADGPQECNCDKVNVRNIADVIHVCGWPQAHSMPPTTKAQSHSKLGSSRRERTCPVENAGAHPPAVFGNHPKIRHRRCRRRRHRQ